MGMRNIVIGQWKKGDPFYKRAKILAELCSCFNVLWKIKLESDKSEYLAEDVSKAKCWSNLVPSHCL